MHSHTVEPWQHSHVFLGHRHDEHERRLWLVVALTATMMVAEIVGGMIFGSMALVADGWHMSTHAGALAIAAVAYRFAREHAHDERFAFGTAKLGELAGFASAVTLGVIAVLIGVESVERLYSPIAIDFDQAIVIAAAGLAVNLVSAWLLHHGEADGEEGEHDHARDHNIEAAYFHVLADAVTSVLAIMALTAGRFLGWSWLDPAAGLVGAFVIAHWSVRLIRSSSAVLLDLTPDPGLARLIRTRLEVGGDRVSDLHLWRLGPGHNALIASVVTDTPQSPSAYKSRLADIKGLSHVTVEVHRCPGHHLAAATSPLTVRS
jgi:cation diffusion facilitator family transporter